MKNTSWLLIFAFAAGLWASDAALANDANVLVYGATGQDVEWTYISPAKKFGPGERTGT